MSGPTRKGNSTILILAIPAKADKQHIPMLVIPAKAGIQYAKPLPALAEHCLEFGQARNIGR
jgi:hypothetical protein